ncbi:hypothetical protein [Halorubrum sp. CBA1229]|jgi:hypothetical protein|nr:hypothetical protein [Halorubrum sp. CBA1229]QKY16238.1 hypothetical protein Hrr1229_004840 [Halorubrum sp. CBA1229]
MSASTPSVGIDHPTVVPANFDRDAEPDDATDRDAGRGDTPDGNEGQSDA